MSNSIRLAVFTGTLVFAAVATAANTASATGLKSGPMLGYSTMSEVFISVQSDAPAAVQIKYWEEGGPEAVRFSATVRTKEETAYVAQLVADNVRPGTVYQYAVYIDGNQVRPRFRAGSDRSGPIPLRFQTQPRWRHTKAANFSPPDFRVALGSCAYRNEDGYNWEEGGEYGAGYQIFESIYEKRPDLMLWLGDNFYFREADWSSTTGIHHRYTRFRSNPFLRALLATAHHYAIWDDHDYGPNDSGYEFWNKDATLDAFKLFWGNPSYGFKDMPGIMTFFNWADVNFYLADNRTYRTNRSGDPAPFGRPKSHLGKQQVDWLVDSLKYHQSQDSFVYASSFNVILTGNPVLNDSGYPDGYRAYREEWQYLIDRIMHAGIDGVIFLSGDVHFSEFSKEVRIGGGRPGEPGKAGKPGERYVFHDLTISPLTAGVYKNPSRNSTRVNIFPDRDDDFIAERNFATLDFHGPKNDRKMTIRIYGTDGNLLNGLSGIDDNASVADLWTLSANDLRAP